MKTWELQYDLLDEVKFKTCEGEIKKGVIHRIVISTLPPLQGQITFVVFYEIVNYEGGKLNGYVVEAEEITELIGSTL